MNDNSKMPKEKKVDQRRLSRKRTAALKDLAFMNNMTAKIENNKSFDLSGQRLYIKQVLSMSNDKIIEEAEKIKQKESRLGLIARAYCREVAKSILKHRETVKGGPNA